MTVAVCVRCGIIKFGAFNPCDSCGFCPRTEIDAAYSIALTDHYFARSVLEEISESMRGGRPPPSLPPHQEQAFREAVRPIMKAQEKRLRRIGVPPLAPDEPSGDDRQQSTDK